AWCSSIVRCIRKLLREPQRPAQLLNRIIRRPVRQRSSHSAGGGNIRAPVFGKFPRKRIRFFFLFAAQYPLFRNGFTANWPRQDQVLLAALEPLLPSPALVC